MTTSLFICCVLIALGALGGWACIVMAGRVSDEARKVNKEEDKP